MPLKINGTTISTGSIIAALTLAFWLGTLSFAVADNSSEIKDQKNDQVRLATIETKLKNLEDDQVEARVERKEIRVEQKEQSKVLNQILVLVSE